MKSSTIWSSPTVKSSNPRASSVTRTRCRPTANLPRVRTTPLTTRWSRAKSSSVPKPSGRTAIRSWTWPTSGKPASTGCKVAYRTPKSLWRRLLRWNAGTSIYRSRYLPSTVSTRLVSSSTLHFDLQGAWKCLLFDTLWRVQLLNVKSDLLTSKELQKCHYGSSLNNSNSNNLTTSKFCSWIDEGEAHSLQVLR